MKPYASDVEQIALPCWFQSCKNHESSMQICIKHDSILRETLSVLLLLIYTQWKTGKLIPWNLELTLGAQQKDAIVNCVSVHHQYTLPCHTHQSIGPSLTGGIKNLTPLSHSGSYYLNSLSIKKLYLCKLHWWSTISQVLSLRLKAIFYSMQVIVTDCFNYCIHYLDFFNRTT